jgi:hypothetical protein
MRRWGLRKAGDSKAQHGGDGEQSSQREGGEEGEKRLATLLTPRRNSDGGSWQQRSGEAVMVTAAEVRPQRQRRG